MPDLFDLFAEPAQASPDACLGCGEIHADAGRATLSTGEEVSTYSESWRLECEARSILRERSLSKRQDRLARIGNIRGATAEQELRDRVLVIWNAMTAKRLAA